MPEEIAQPGPDGRVVRAFHERFDSVSEPVLVRAPGRVNLIGDHTDYNDGFVLPTTLAHAMYVAVRARNDDRVRLYSVDYDEHFEASLSELPGKGSSWQHYVCGVLEALQQRGIKLSGIDATFHSTVPIGSGLSSSAALEVASLLAAQAVADFEMEPKEAAVLCQHVEHTFIGVACGIMDQLVSRMGKAGHALLLDCRTLDVEHIPLRLPNHAFIIADSRAPRSLAASKYNERRSECEQGIGRFQEIDASIRALRDITPVTFERHAGRLEEPVRSRCRHVVNENDRVVKAVDALKSGRAEELGLLMHDSHASLRDDYEVSSDELDVLVDIAMATEGVLGARMTGAGFGGCIVALVERKSVPSLANRLVSDYGNRFDRDPGVFVLDENVEAGIVTHP